MKGSSIFSAMFFEAIYLQENVVVPYIEICVVFEMAAVRE